MLFNGIELPAGWQGTARLVRECNRCRELVWQTDRYPDVFSVLAYPHIEEVAAVVVLRHPDQVPGDYDLVSLAFSPDIGRRGVKGVCDGQANRLYDDCMGVADNINNVRGNPTVLSHPVHPYIEPVTSVRGATIDGAGVASTQVPCIKVSLRRAPKAGCGSFVHSDFGEIKGGGGGDCGCGSNCRSGRRGGCEC